MNITKTITGSELLLSVSGNLDSVSAPQLEKAVNDSVTGISKLIFDFEKVDYVSSAGLRVLLLSHKIMAKQGSMVVRHVNKEVMDIFELTGFTSFLTIE